MAIISFYRATTADAGRVPEDFTVGTHPSRTCTYTPYPPTHIRTDKLQAHPMTFPLTTNHAHTRARAHTLSHTLTPLAHERMQVEESIEAQREHG